MVLGELSPAWCVGSTIIDIRAASGPTNIVNSGFGGTAYGRVYVSLLPVVEACVVVRGRVCEVRVASTADEAEAIRVIMIVDLTLSYGRNYFVRRLHYTLSVYRRYGHGVNQFYYKTLSSR